MTYKKNFVVAVKVDGKVLRESGEEVQLPFGSEYSVLLKNLNAVRAMAQISIDGKEAGPWCILEPNSTVEIERFNNSGNKKQGNRFKFVERNSAVEEYRGIQAEDGLIRVEFKKEKFFELPKVVEHHTYHHHYPYYPYIPKIEPFWPHQPSITWCNNSTLGALSSPVRAMQMMKCSLDVSEQSAKPNEAGITVQGGLSNQEFVSVSGFQCEPSEVISLKLIGKHGPVEITRPVTVDIRAKCQTCGKRAKANAKFCSVCGTSLQII